MSENGMPTREQAYGAAATALGSDHLTRWEVTAVNAVLALLSQSGPSAEPVSEQIAEVLTSWFPEYEGVGSVIEDAAREAAQFLQYRVAADTGKADDPFPAVLPDEATDALRRKMGEHRG